MYFVHISQELFIQSTLHLAGLFLTTQGSAVCDMFNINTFRINSKHHFGHSGLMALQTEAGLTHEPSHVISLGSRYKQN